MTLSARGQKSIERALLTLFSSIAERPLNATEKVIIRNVTYLLFNS